MSGSSISFDLIARDKASATFDKVATSAERTHSHLSAIGAVGRKAAVGLAGLATGLGAVGVMGLKTAAANEQAQIAFTTMLGSAKKAHTFLQRLQAFAASTPFEFPELQQAASSLISAGINAKNVIPIMRTLGDVTSGMGTGAEGVQRATVALQQMSAAGRITGEDLNQLRDAGIPVFDLLASATGKSKAEIVKLAQAGKLGKTELDKMMHALETGKGLERFSGLMDKQSHSLSGMVSTLKDTFGQGLAQAVAPAIPTVEKMIGGLTTIVAKGMPALGKLFASIDLSGMIDKVKSAFGGIDLSGIATGLAMQAKTWAAPVISGFSTGLNTGDWSALGKALGNGIIRALGALGSLIGRLGKIFGNLFGKVDWVGIGITMGKQAPSLLIGLAAGILNFDLGGLLKGLASHWQDVLLAVLALAVAPAKWVGKIAELLGRIPFAGKLLEWGLNAMKRFSDGIVGKIGQFLGFLGRGFLSGFRRVFPTVGKAFYEGLLLLPTRLGVIALDVQGKAGKMMVGLARAIGRGIFTVAAKIGELVARILKPFASAGGWLIDAGRAVVGGLGRGIGKALGMVGSALAAVGRAVVRATAGFGKLLYSAGKDIMRGLINGIGSMAGAVGHKVTSIAHGAVSAVKGALGIHSPSRVFSEIGVNMIEGLVRGIDKRKVKLDTVLSKLTDYITRQGDKIASLLDAKKGVVSSVQGFASSVFGADFSEQGGASIGNIIAFQKQQRDQARQLQADIRRLTQMGLSKNLVQQLVDSGSGGEANIHALAGASAAQIAQLNALNNQTNAALTSAGSAAGGALYNDQIAQAKRDQALAVAIRRELEAMRKDQDKNTVIQLHLEGRTLQASLLQLKRKNGNRALGLA